MGCRGCQGESLFEKQPLLMQHAKGCATFQTVLPHVLLSVFNRTCSTATATFCSMRPPLPLCPLPQNMQKTYEYLLLPFERALTSKMEPKTEQVRVG